MPQQKHNPEQLKAYREAAVELHELSLGVKQQLDKAGETGQLQDAKAALSELQARTEAFTNLRESLGLTGIFLAKYNVVVHNDHTVSFVLPKGVSRVEMLEEAQGLVTERDLIYPGQLTEWKQDPKFTKEAERSERILIDGHVQGGDEKTRAQQEDFLKSKNLSMPALEDLAVAFAAHWVATGEPLFGWYNKSNEWSYGVRAVGGALYFSGNGLRVVGIRDDYSDSHVAVAASAFAKASADESAGVLTKADKPELKIR